MDLMKYTRFPHPYSGKKYRQLLGRAAAFVLSVVLAAAPVTVLAESDYDLILSPDGLEDYYGETEFNKKQPIQTNEISSWPKGPRVGAAGAVVMDADSGAVLYAKNPTMRLYPASITKVMTGLLAYENLNKSDMITFSEEAVFGIESGSSNIGMDVGESITLDQALYGLMVASANEVANAIGERVSGSGPAFIDLMNQRAEELGCAHTHFVTANGLHDNDHYSCAYDMALIAREAYKYPELIEYMSQNNYHFEASATQPDDFWLGNTNSFLNGGIPCEGVIGGKTGYTDQARETLVTFASRGDMNLICVIMREEPPHQYYDTVNLLDYAFENFQKIRIDEEESRFTLQSADFLGTGKDMFGNSSPYYTISPDAYLTIPKKASFQDLTAEITPISALSGKSSVQSSPDDDSPDGNSPDENSSNKDSSNENSSAGSSGSEPSEKESSAQGSTSTETAADASASDKTASDRPAADKNVSGESSSDTDTSAAVTAVEVAGISPLAAVEDGKKILGVISYSYKDYPVGTANVLFTPGKTTYPEEVHGIRRLAFSLLHTGAHGSIYLNILLLIPLVLAVTFLLCVFFFIRSYFVEMKRIRTRRTRRARQALQAQQGQSPDSDRDRPADFERDDSRQSGQKGSPGRTRQTLQNRGEGAKKNGTGNRRSGNPGKRGSSERGRRS